MSSIVIEIYIVAANSEENSNRLNKLCPAFLIMITIISLTIMWSNTQTTIITTISSLILCGISNRCEIGVYDLFALDTNVANAAYKYGLSGASNSSSLFGHQEEMTLGHSLVHWNYSATSNYNVVTFH